MHTVRRPVPFTEQSAKAARFVDRVRRFMAKQPEQRCICVDRFFASPDKDADRKVIDKGQRLHGIVDQLVRVIDPGIGGGLSGWRLRVLRFGGNLDFGRLLCDLHRLAGVVLQSRPNRVDQRFHLGQRLCIGWHCGFRWCR